MTWLISPGSSLTSLRMRSSAASLPSPAATCGGVDGMADRTARAARKVNGFQNATPVDDGAVAVHGVQLGAAWHLLTDRDHLGGLGALAMMAMPSVGSSVARTPASTSGMLDGGVDAAPQRGERDAPVHGAGVEVVEARAGRRAPAPRWTCRPRPGRRWRSPSRESRRYRAGRRGPRRSRGTSWPRSRDPRSRRPARAGRRGRSSSPCGGRRRCARAPGGTSPGRTTKPSASSSASTPRRRSSRTTPPTRSLSLARMNPMPVTRVGVRGEGGHDGQRGRRVGEVGHVDLDAVERRRRRSPSWRRRSAPPSRPCGPARSTKREVALVRRAGPSPGTRTVRRRWRRRRRSTTPPTRRARRRTSVAR